MVELVDTRDLKSREPCARASSILALGTSELAVEKKFNDFFSTAFFMQNLT
jgi:hypothetical protein